MDLLYFSRLSLAEIGVFSPFIGFAIACGLGIGAKSDARIDRFSQIITCSLMFFCLISSILIFYEVGIKGGQSSVDVLAPWFDAGSLSVSWGLKIDVLSATMMAVVSTVSFLVHIYSVGYMSHDHSIPRFMGYLSLFTFAMMALVTAPNFLQLFFGWEGVGLASYLLIGFWYEKPAANAAAIKAFVVNRVGDIGLALGICAIFMIFKTVDFEFLFKALESIADGSTPAPQLVYLGLSVDALTLIGILLFIGAMGKSAQLGLHTWLPDAMEGPTPVSALIHAATMVTAGVFLVARLSPLYELAPYARNLVCVVGASTAFFAATIAITQNDIKRIIAYSTCSQLGYMFFAAGVSAYGAAMFHLVTHAFFKALLFLGAGAVIHALSDEQDIRRMGGIHRLIPVTYIVMWIGSLALAGIPFFAGYYSKDSILEAAYLQGTAFGDFAYYVGLLVAILTAFYSWRLLILVFHGTPRANDRVMAHVHEAPLSMKIPLIALAVGACLSGYLGKDLFLNPTFWAGSLSLKAMVEQSEMSYFIVLLPTFCAIFGIVLAYFLYTLMPNVPDRLATTFKGLYQFSYHKWFIDELYDRVFVAKANDLGIAFWKKGDGRIIDRFGPDGATTVSLAVGKGISRLQTGFVYHYAFAMLIGIVALTTWLLLSQEEGIFPS